MEANMQCNGYFPGYHSPMNLSLDANGSTWRSDCHDKIFESENFYNGFSSSNSLLAYNKDMLKQTMLKHETIFKDQIQELHRLYRRQRELMDKIRRNNLNKHYLRFEASHSNTPFFQTSSEYDQKTFQVSGFPLIKPAGSQVSPLSSFQGKEAQVCHSYSTRSEACAGDVQLFESKGKKIGKKLLDLQLPADEYIDSEDKDLLDDEKVSEVTEVSSYSVKRSPQVVYTSDVKSFFGSYASNSVFLGAVQNPSILEKQKWSADLNEPGKLKEEVGSLSNGFVGPSSHSKLLCSEPLEKAKLGFQYSFDESIRNASRRPDIEVSTNFLLSERGGKEEQLSYHDKSGKLGNNLNSFLHGFNAEKSSLFPKSSNKDLEKVYEPPTFHQGNQSSLIEITILDLENSRRNSAPSNDNHHGRHASFYESNFNNQGSWTNMKNTGRLAVQKLPCESGRNPIAVQALPCFASVHLGKRCESSIGKSELDGGSKLMPDNHSLNIRSSNDVYLNSKPPSCSSEFAVSQNVQTTDGTENHGYSVGGLNWLREKSVHNVKENNGRGSLTRVEPVSLEAYSAGICDVEPKKVETSDCLSKRLPGFHDHNKSYLFGHHSSPSSSLHKTWQNPIQDVKSSGKDSVIDLNLACDLASETEIELTADEHVGENGVNRKHSSFGCLIDLNSSINEAGFTQKSSLVAEIDLDAPASPENKESSPPRGESDENQAETPVLLLGQEGADQQDELAKIAAEALISISSFKSLTSLQKPSFERLEVSSVDSLHWFAGVVSSVASYPESEFGLVLTDKNNFEELFPDEMDYFEAMTLKLTEAKLEECCYKTNVSKQEETGTSSSPSQQRKGRTRRGGRQRKDFQREILPSLASLSRYEVTEDLQTIGGLMEAAGTHWESGSTRNAARNGYSRARKRSSVAASIGVGCSVESLKQLSSSYSKVGKEERSVICWGQVTRRRRGQRCPVRVGNQQLILSQV